MNHDSELWQSYGDNGIPIVGVGHAKQKFENSDLICAASHVWIWRKNINDEKEILLQLRAKNKLTWPGFWDISAAGHVNVNENYVAAAARETFEEIGCKIEIEKLYFAFSDRVKPPKSTHNSIRFVYLYELLGDYEFIFHGQEVEKLKWVSIEELRRIVSEDTEIVPHSNEYFSQIFNQLEQ